MAQADHEPRPKSSRGRNMNDSVSQAISGKSRDFQSQLAAGQVAASLGITHLLTILSMKSGRSSPHSLWQHSWTTLSGLLLQMIRYISFTCVFSHSHVVSRFVSLNAPSSDNYAWSSGKPSSTMTSLVVLR